MFPDDNFFLLLMCLISTLKSNLIPTPTLPKTNKLLKIKNNNNCSEEDTWRKKRQKTTPLGFPNFQMLPLTCWSIQNYLFVWNSTCNLYCYFFIIQEQLIFFRFLVSLPHNRFFRQGLRYLSKVVPERCGILYSSLFHMIARIGYYSLLLETIKCWLVGQTLKL